MKIELSKTLVEFTPEADHEKTMLEGLWRMLVDCARFNQKLVPVGEYVPEKNNTARPGFKHPGYGFHRGRLSRTIWSNQRKNLTRVYRKRCRLHCNILSISN